jgi:hypothetical protein
MLELYMAAFDDATLRQQEILTQLAGRMGFRVNDLSNVTYDRGIPVEISIENATERFSRSTKADLGGIITDFEQQQFLLDRSENRTVITAQTNRPNSGNPSNNQIGRILSAVDQSQQTASTVSNLNSIADPSLGRLQSSRLNPGAVVKRNTRDTTVNRFPSAARDLRVKISDPSRRISQLGGALEPLKQTDYKIVFPFTPEISITHSANYTPSSPTHSNYEYLFYQNSSVSEISINGTFVARSPADADYVLAVQHFFRSITKMFYGQDDIAGLPPVVCRLEGHGDLQFSYVPIVITGFTVNLPSDVDYISATNPNNGRVPTSQVLLIQAKPIYSRSRITNNFSLTKFAQGALLGDPDRGTGGFI